MSEIIKVGMADLKTCLPPNGITTLGLGSCVGIALRDKLKKVGGLAHIMLPDSTVIANQTNLAKFADTGIMELIRQMELLGANRRNMTAKIAGGATMFAVSSRSSNGSVAPLVTKVFRPAGCLTGLLNRPAVARSVRNPPRVSS